MKLQRFSRGGGTHLRAQGATEYLVLLAVVLIVALVSVALLGFFPGMASDSQMTQNKMYWSSASPISIVESSAYFLLPGSGNVVYLRLRNTGAYPIRITKIIGSTGYASKYYNGASSSISNYFYLAPGEEKFIGTSIMGGSKQFVYFWSTEWAGANDSIVVSSVTPGTGCSTASPWGTVMMSNFGFEYILYLEGQQITKKFIGAKPLMIKCVDASATS